MDDIDIAAAIIPSGDDETGTAAIAIDPELQAEIDDMRSATKEVTAAEEDPESVSVGIDLTSEVVAAHMGLTRIIDALKDSPLAVPDKSVSMVLRLSEKFRSRDLRDAAENAFGVRNKAFSDFLRSEKLDPAEIHKPENAGVWLSLRSKWQESNQAG
ncbi:MAG: hypothetical protein F9B45_29170 [Phycisphaera sp. RhM]|nr:hypothetical protein [Phycisphaera sp. RhM]